MVPVETGSTKRALVPAHDARKRRTGSSKASTRQTAKNAHAIDATPSSTPTTFASPARSKLRATCAVVTHHASEPSTASGTSAAERARVSIGCARRA